ncbi:hypothetical protein HYX15_01465 [Candidatus Woesearchaeota archaeon]|nr:hypothetical protein [Candidatus Woesearchaeota archaeon]
MKYLFVIIGIIGLILMSIFSLTQYNNYFPAIKDLEKYPEKYDGVLTEQYGKIEEIREDGFILALGNEKIFVKSANVRKPIYGTVSVVGIFHKEGFIELKDIHYFDYNTTKYVISIIGLIIFLVIFFKEWKITSRGFKYARLD